MCGHLLLQLSTGTTPGFCNQPSMAYPQYTQALELDSISADGASLAKMLLSRKVSALRSGIFIPDSLIAEMEQFSVRNSLGNLIDAKYLTKKPTEVCPKCLKAHALHHASLLGLPKESQAFIEKVLPGSVGHHGYYMDEDKVVQID